jgi:spermidine synthase
VASDAADGSASSASLTVDSTTAQGSVTGGVSARERATLLVSVLIISVCALTYELVIATLSSYLLGDSVTQFSFTIGLFLFAMGLGALLSRRIRGSEVRWFITVELLTGLFGGISAAVLYAVYTTSEAYYYTAMILLTLVIGTCIGLEIPLLTRIVANRADLSKALADVLSVDYLGALVASLAFPVILLPMLGVTQTAYLMGLFNVAVAVLNLHLFRKRLAHRGSQQLWGLVGVGGLVLLAGAITSTDFVHFFERRLYQDPVIHQEQSPYQRIIFTRGGSDLRLFLNGNLQFSSRDEYRYHELLVHPVMSLAHSHENIAVLGGGDGLVARELLQYKDVGHITIIDLDPAITRLAQTYPALKSLNRDSMNNPRVTIVNDDAYKFLEQTDDLFSVIIVDLPDPNNEALSKLYSREFYRLLRTRLTPDGVFITQAASPYFVREAFWSIVHTIQSSEFHAIPLRTYVPSFGEWGFVIGSPIKPRSLSIPEELTLRYLTPEVLQAAQTFDPDVAEVPAEVNTLNNPILLRYYDQGWRQWN